MKIHINFAEFESRQNGTMTIEVEASDILQLIKDLQEASDKARVERHKADAEAAKAEAYRQKPGKA